MLSVLVVHPEGSRRAALTYAARSNATVVRESETVPPAPALARFDVLVSDLDAARRAGLLRKHPAGYDRPLVLLCPGAAPPDLEPGRHTVALSADPAPDALRAAIQNAHDGLPRTAPHPPPPPPAATARGLGESQPATPDARPGAQVAAAEDLDSVAELVARALGGVSVVVSVIDPARQHFVGHHGLPADLVAARGIPIAWSGCQHAVALSAPLVARDAHEHPLFRDNVLVQLNLFRAYAGVPFAIEGAGTGATGTICALDDQVREFDPREMAVLELAARLSSEILARRPARGEALVPGAPPPGGHPAGESDVAVGAWLDGKYLITAALGQGGQAEVFLGRDRLVGQLVAIKVISDTGGGESVLLREASLLAGVRHAGVVRMYGWGRTPRGRLFIVLEYLEGDTLATRLRAGHGRGVEAGTVLALVRQVGEALEALHARGIVHGDVKAGNVMLGADGRAVLFDFGVACMGAAGEEFGPADGGTPGFSAPEQFDGGALTPRSDVYALAALAYQLLAGRGPYAGVPFDARVAAQQSGPPEALSRWRASAGAEMDRLFTEALSPRPEARPATVGEFVARLARAVEDAS